MVSKSGSGRTTYVKIGIWYNEEDKSIHMSVEGHNLTSVNDNPKSRRGNPSLFKKLARVLRDAGAKHPPIV